MSTRVLASIGVALCMAMTSFSIYLGVIEHIYAPRHTYQYVLQTNFGTQEICVPVPTHHSTTRRHAHLRVTPVPCPAPRS